MLSVLAAVLVALVSWLGYADVMHAVVHSVDDVFDARTFAAPSDDTDDDTDDIK